jgi:hypothetical protein
VRSSCKRSAALDLRLRFAAANARVIHRKGTQIPKNSW